MSLLRLYQELIVLRRKKLPSFSASSLSTLLLRGAKKKQMADQVGGLTHVHPSLRLSKDEREKGHLAVCIYTYVDVYIFFYLTVFVLFHIVWSEHLFPCSTVELRSVP